jgi:RNA polymerase sigma factor (sigma-70 family)
MHRGRHLPENDASLLSDGARGFARFYSVHERAVLAFFVRRVGRADLAADLTAETFARALAGRDRVDPSVGDVRGWLFGIAQHLLVDSLRRGSVEDSARRQLGMAPVAVNDQALDRIDGLAGDPALAALAGLPINQQEAVRGHVRDEREYDDLARELRCSPGVVRQRVSRGLRALRNRLEEQQ